MGREGEEDVPKRRKKTQKQSNTEQCAWRRRRTGLLSLHCDRRN
jgi:hypothetical protein